MKGPRRDLFGNPVHQKGKRTEGDAYYTPSALAEVLVGLLPMTAGETALEPSAGGGSFCRALHARGAVVTAMDVDPAAPAIKAPERPWATRTGDFLSASGLGRFDWVVGNPPYAMPGDAVLCTKCKGKQPKMKSCTKCKGCGYSVPMVPCVAHHSRRALEVADKGVAFLVRLAILAGQKRNLLWRSHPPAKVWVLPQRPSYTGGGTDQYDYCWIVWLKGHEGQPELGWAPPYR